MWSRPPNRRPISGSERSVRVFARVHRDLTRANHVGGAPRRQQVRPADIVLTGDDPLNVLDLDPLGLLRPHQVAHFALGHFQRHRGGVELAVGEQAIDRAFKVAAIVRDGLRQIIQHRSGTSKDA